MSIIYFECKMGAAGDMLTSALLELHPDPNGFLSRLNNCGVKNVSIQCEKSVKCGVSGTHIEVLIDGIPEHQHHHHDEHHHHEHMCVSDIKHIIEHLNISEQVKTDAHNVFMILADAESKVHGTTIEQVHFHEVGTIDAVIDIVAVCMLLDEIKPTKIYTSPINVGGGYVKCAHGILPVPAPATAEILKGVPVYSGSVKSELCTPTGAALLKYFTDKFCEMPVISIMNVGYGMGRKDFEIPNCVRVFLCEESGGVCEAVSELICNIDDMTGEELGYTSEVLMKAGALDVWTSSIYMKKSRPAVMLNCLCKTEDTEKFIRLIFKHTTTLGIRKKEFERYFLEREVVSKYTELGDIRIKKSFGWGTIREKAEYEDIVKIAKERDISISEVKKYM